MCLRRCQVEESGELFYSLDDGHTRFTDLLQLVEFYQLNRGVLPSKLKHHCARITLWIAGRPVEAPEDPCDAPRPHGPLNTRGYFGHQLVPWTGNSTGGNHPLYPGGFHRPPRDEHRGPTWSTLVYLRWFMKDWCCLLDIRRERVWHVDFSGPWWRDNHLRCGRRRECIASILQRLFPETTLLSYRTKLILTCRGVSELKLGVHWTMVARFVHRRAKSTIFNLFV